MFEVERIKKYIDDRLKEIWFTSKHWNPENPNIVFYLSPFVNGYEIVIFNINEKNIRCEFNKKPYYIGIDKKHCLSSCVVSDWQKNHYKPIDEWIENFLIIPDVKPLYRSLKINKLKENVRIF